MSAIERRGGNLANGLQQAGFSAKSVDFRHVFQHLVKAPSALLPSVVHTGSGVIRGVRWQLVDDFTEETDDDALAVQLQRCTESEDQLKEQESRLAKFLRGS